MSDHETTVKTTQVSATRYAYQPRCACGWAAAWLSAGRDAAALAAHHERTAK